MQVLKDDPAVLQYQLTQHETQRFALTLATVDEAAFRQARDRALPRLESLLGPGAKIESRYAAPDRRDERKFRAVASRCRPPAAL